SGRKRCREGPQRPCSHTSSSANAPLGTGAHAPAGLEIARNLCLLLLRCNSVVAPALRPFDTFQGGFEGLSMNAANFDRTLVLIPARMASTRLPDKPLADIAGQPMIVQVARRALSAGAGRVVVAVDHRDIHDVV